MRKLCNWSTAALVVLCATATGAAAQSPSENSGIDQYTENVPAADGDKPSDESLGGGPSDGGSGDREGPLPPAVADELQAAGPAGQAAAALAEATAPRTRTESESGRRADAESGSGATGLGSAASGGGGVGSTLDRIAGGSSESGGMGIALPIILGASLVAAALYGVSRRKSSGEPGNA